MNKRTFASSPVAWLMVLIIILAAAALRIRLLDVPLERDEGDYAYMAQLLLQGVPPYTEAYEVRLPGIFAAYAWILTFFGETHTAIHLGLLLINALTILLIFLLGRKLGDSTVGIAAGAFYAALSLSPSMHGAFAHAEHFVNLFTTAGLILLVDANRSKSSRPLFFSGLALGTAFLMKQQGAFFIAFAGLYFLYLRLAHRPLRMVTRTVSECVLFAAACLIPVTLTSYFLSISGAFDSFWFWTFTYARQYISFNSLADGWSLFETRMQEIVAPAWLLWILSILGLAALAQDKKLRPQALFVWGFLLFSLFAVAGGFYFRHHYFLLLLPAASLLAGSAIRRMADLFSEKYSVWTAQILTMLFILIPIAQFMASQRAFLFQWNPSQISRMIYGGNPFPEALRIAKYIREHSAPNDRIAVIGSEPEIYFYSGRRSATPYILMYPLMEAHPYALRMQLEMMRDIETAGPKFLVAVHVQDSWLRQPHSKSVIFQWFRSYSERNYEQVGALDIHPDRTEYFWDEKSRGHTPGSNYWIEIYRRNS